MRAMTRAKFPLGQVVATPGALEALAESGQTPAFFLGQHASGSWGVVDEEDWALNDEALKDGRPTCAPGSRWTSGDHGGRSALTWLHNEGDFITTGRGAAFPNDADQAARRVRWCKERRPPGCDDEGGQRTAFKQKIPGVLPRSA